MTVDDNSHPAITLWSCVSLVMLCLLVSMLLSRMEWMEMRWSEGKEQRRGEGGGRKRRGPSSEGNVIAVIVRTGQPETEKRRSGDRTNKAVASYRDARKQGKKVQTGSLQ